MKIRPLIPMSVHFVLHTEAISRYPAGKSWDNICVIMEKRLV